MRAATTWTVTTTADNGAGDDTIDGGNGDDILRGNAGNDILRGEAGNDRLEGGDDNATLTGGFGADSFNGGTGTDSATDFASAQSDTKGCQHSPKGAKSQWVDRSKQILTPAATSTECQKPRSLRSMNPTWPKSKLKNACG